MLGNSLLLLTALTGAVLLFRHSERLAEAPQSQLQVSSLSLVFIALAAMGQLLLTPAGPGQDVATLQRLLDNLALYAGLPLLATATLALAMGWYWSKAGWGRWLLALFALFELCRRMGLGEDYTLWLSVALAAALAGAAWRLRSLVSRAAVLLAAPLVLLGISADTLLTAELPAQLQTVLLAGGLGLVSYGLLHQTRATTPAQ